MKVKRILCIYLLLLITISPSVFAQTRLNFWTEYSTNPEKGVMEQIVQDFNTANPGIEIIHRGIENELFFTAMRTAFSGGNAPDIFQHEGFDNLFQFVRSGQVLDITSWFLKHEDRFMKEFIGSIEMNKKYWGIPWKIETASQIFYNEDILQAYDIAPPQTWDEFLAACETLKASGVTPIALGNRYGWPGGQLFFALATRTAGTDFLLNLAKRQEGYHWTDPNVVRAAELYQELNDRGYFSAGKASDDQPTSKALFLAGRAAFFHSGSWFISDLDVAAPPDFRMGMLEFPQLSPDDQYGGPTEIVGQALQGISISATTKDPDAAFKFLEYLLQPEVVRKWTVGVNGLSAIKGTVSEDGGSVLAGAISEMVNKAEKITPFLDQITPPEVGEGGLFMQSVAILTGDLTAHTWMQQVEELASELAPVL